MVPGQGDVLDGVGDGGGAGGGSQGARAPLQGRDALLEHVAGGVHEPGVDVAPLGAGEAARRLSGVLADVAGGGVNGHRPRVGGGIGLLLAGVDLDGLELIL